MAQELHIAISPETLFNVGGFEVTNTLFTSYLVSTLFILFLFFARTQLKQTNRPTGLQNILEAIVDGLMKFVESITGPTARAMTFAPIISGFFVFILLNNWVELIPGFHTIVYTGEPTVRLTQVPNTASEVFAAEPAEPESHDDSAESVIDPHLTETADDADIVSTEAHPEEGAEHASDTEQHQEEGGHHGVALLRGAHADLNMTLALSLISVVLTQYFGIKYIGLGYFKKYLDLSGPIPFFVGILETISEFSKILSFAFRLFGNIFAGEVLIAVISFLIPVILPMPFYGLELFVGFIQALVFSMLSLVYFNMAAEKHH